MSWWETLRAGMDAVRSHRLRSGLTMLGILIGIAAVILTVGFGEGAQQKVSSQINALGTNLLVVTPGSSTTGGVRGGFGSASTLTRADADALASRDVAPDVAAVAPTVSRSQSLAAGATTWTSPVVGTTDSWARVRSRTVSAGRFLTADDITSAAAVAVLAPTTATELFGAADPVGQTVDVSGVPFTVVGELASIGSSASTNEDDQVIVPLPTAVARLFGTNAGSVQTIYLEAASPHTISAAYQEATGELTSLHHLGAAATPDFTITSQQSVLSTATSVDRTLTVLLAGIAAISLLVGGIGVMNIMLVSVTERIREIGLRKALGATPGAIRRQFLIEASVLGLAGGLLGVVLGIAGAELIPHLTAAPIRIDPAATAGSIVIAIGIGVGFGVYPASRAARLAPIDALRSE